VSLFLLDTDHLTLYQLGHPRVLHNIVSHSADRLAISVISVEEQLTGWQRALAQAKDNARREQIYTRMALTVEMLSSWSIITFTSTAMMQHSALMRQHLNIGSNDVKIATIALENNATVVTRNLRDFSRVPGLSCVDWAV
jgi:tRNA(fMet)-specific endonuclease VapC